VRRWFSVALVVALAAPAQAGELEVNWPVDMTVTGVGALVYILTETAFKKQLGPDECRWCDEPLNGLDREVREGLRWESTRTADYVSNVTGFMLAPASALGLLGIIAEVDGKRANWPADGLVVVESAVVASAITQLVKMTAARERPFVHFAASSDPRLETVEDHMSFFSGHSSASFSSATAGSILYSSRTELKWSRYTLWGLSHSIAGFTAQLRMCAGRHYRTDIWTGSVVGVGLGVLVPWLNGIDLSRVHDAEVALAAGAGLLTMGLTEALGFCDLMQRIGVRDLPAPDILAPVDLPGESEEGAKKHPPVPPKPPAPEARWFVLPAVLDGGVGVQFVGQL